MPMPMPMSMEVPMEHRWHLRKPVRLEMIAQSSTLGLICTTSRNISLGGILLDTGEACLSSRVVVELSCCLLHEAHCRFYSVRAQVVYAGSGCAGLMFLDHEAAYAKFEAVLKAVINAPYSKEISNSNCLLHCSECECKDIKTAPLSSAA